MSKIFWAERGIIVSYEAIRQWCWKFGPDYARRLKKKQGRLGDTWYLDELFVTINGQQQYLWRAVDQDGDVIDILLQPAQRRLLPAMDIEEDCAFQPLVGTSGTAPRRQLCHGGRRTR